jgi:hypothetical protein
MRRFTAILVLAAIVLGIAAAVGGGNAVAQQPGFANHPAVGSWRVHRDPENSTYPLELMILSADGAVLDFGSYGTTGVGAWKPTGADTAIVTFTLVTDGPAYIVMRANITVASDGQSFKGTFTTEIVFDPAHHGTSGEIGPGVVEGARMATEAPGTPVASFAEFFPNPLGTPAATPVS